MLRRVFEGVVIAVASSVAAVTLSTAASREEFIDRVLEDMSRGAPAHGWLWFAAVATFTGGLTARITSRVRRRRSGDPWHSSFGLDRIAPGLFALSGGLGSAALAIGLATDRSVWALPLGALILYWCFRAIATARYRASRIAGL